MSRIRGISQRMQGVTMEKIIPIFTIASLDHNCYPGVKIRYLTGDPALVKCNLIDLRSILSSEYTRQQALGLPSSTPPPTVNRVSYALSQPATMVIPQTRPIQPPLTTSSTYYPPPRGFPLKRILPMVWSNMWCPGCSFNKPDDPPRLKFHQ